MTVSDRANGAGNMTAGNAAAPSTSGDGEVVAGGDGDGQGASTSPGPGATAGAEVAAGASGQGATASPGPAGDDPTCRPPSDVDLADVSALGLGRFRVGDQVRVRATPTEPTDNPRTPDYAIGHVGEVRAVHGVIDNPRDHHRAYPPMYSIVFDGAVLFGAGATHAVVAEVHDEWLDPA
jgi:hypothetical protein